jgi:hypothetical protein
VALVPEELNDALDKDFAITESFKLGIHDQVFQLVLKDDGEPENGARILNAHGSAKVAEIPEIHKVLEIVAREAACHQLAGVCEIKIHEDAGRRLDTNDGHGHLEREERREEKRDCGWEPV